VGKRLNGKDIHTEMFSIYGGKCLLRKAVHNWVEKFSQGGSKAADDARPGHPDKTVTEATVQRVKELILAERMITIDSAGKAIGQGCECWWRIRGVSESSWTMSKKEKKKYWHNVLNLAAVSFKLISFGTYTAIPYFFHASKTP
jgi:transposase